MKVPAPISKVSVSPGTIVVFNLSMYNNKDPMIIIIPEMKFFLKFLFMLKKVWKRKEKAKIRKVGR